jgi:hypothetical protein
VRKGTALLLLPLLTIGHTAAVWLLLLKPDQKHVSTAFTVKQARVQGALKELSPAPASVQLLQDAGVSMPCFQNCVLS